MKKDNVLEINKANKILPDYNDYTSDSLTNIIIDKSGNFYLMIEGRIYFFDDLKRFLASFNIQRGKKFCVDRNLFFILTDDQKLHRVTVNPNIVTYKPIDNKFFKFTD